MRHLFRNTVMRRRLPLLCLGDYREDGMDLGSDACSSRSSSESGSSKVTPCSECKSSPSPSSLDSAALEDSEEEEGYLGYGRKGTAAWEEDRLCTAGCDATAAKRRSLAEELEDVIAGLMALENEFWCPWNRFTVGNGNTSLSFQPLRLFLNADLQ
ncbi:unnamed protein product [Caretta caretta]